MIISVCPHCRREIDVDGDRFSLLGKKVKCRSCGRESLYEATVMSSVKFKNKHGDKGLQELMSEAIDDAVSLGSILLPMSVFDVMARTALLPSRTPVGIMEGVIKDITAKTIEEMLVQLQQMLKKEFGSAAESDDVDESVDSAKESN